MPTSYRVLYFTGTGNAAYVANEIFKKLEVQSNGAKILAADELRRLLLFVT